MGIRLSRGPANFLGLTMGIFRVYTLDMATDQEKRTHSAQLHIRLTPEHDHLVREAAEHAGQTLTNWIRGVLVREARRELAR